MSTLTTAQREDILSYFSDLFKDAYGSRPRFNYRDLSDEELKSEHDHLVKIVEDKEIREAQQQAENYIAFKKHLRDICRMCNCKRKQAMRFILDAHDLLESKNYEYLCFQLGLNYSVANEMKRY